DAAQGLPGASQDQGLANLGISKSVLRYDIAQTLSGPEQTQAQANLGVAPSSSFNPSAGRLQLTPGSISSGHSQSLAFMPYNGQYVKINGLIYPVPAAGVTAVGGSCFKEGVAAQALTALRTYYVFVFNNGGTLALDFCQADVATPALWALTYGGGTTVGTKSHRPSIAAGNVGTEV